MDDDETMRRSRELMDKQRLSLDVLLGAARITRRQRTPPTVIGGVQYYEIHCCRRKFLQDLIRAGHLIPYERNRKAVYLWRLPEGWYDDGPQPIEARR